MRFNSLLLIFSCLLYVNVLHAENPDTTKGYPFIKGTKALQFRVNSLLSLDPFQGSLISYQEQLTSEKARRIGVSISSKLWNGDGSHDELRYSSYDSTYDTTDYSFTRNEYSFALSISVQQIKYESLKKGFFFYSGAGPTLGFSYTERNIKPKTEFDSSNKYLSKYINIGYGGVIGVEWLIKKNMSLLAEYRSTISAGYKYISQYLKFVSSSGSYNIRDEITKGPTFNFSSGVKIGLSIYL